MHYHRGVCPQKLQKKERGHFEQRTLKKNVTLIRSTAGRFK